MYLAGGLVIIVYLIWGIAAMREQTTEKGVLQPFSRMAMLLYKKTCIWGLPWFQSVQVRQDLQRLHPGENLINLETEYYVKKLGIMLAVILAGTVLAMAVKLQGQGVSDVLEGGLVQRGEYDEGDKQIVLEAEAEGLGSQQVEITVAERELGQREVIELEQQFWQEISGMVAADNISLQQVWKDISCPEELEGYPFWVEWCSSHPQLVSSKGMVGETEAAEGEKVVLTATIHYSEHEWEHELELVIVPPHRTEEELLEWELERLLLEAEQADRSSKTWQLPQELKGKKLIWSEKTEDNSWLLWGLVMIAGIGTYPLTDRDLHTKLEERGKQMQCAYPLIVNKLVLYLGAGMTVRRAWQKISSDYEKNVSQGRHTHPAYEEMEYTCHELQTGVAEGAAYERFGQRTGLAEYIKLAALLNQNLKKGSNELLLRLREEADSALAQQTNYRKKAGEEASTKLLVPMVMLLGIVMVLVMIPAFSSFGGM